MKIKPWPYVFTLLIFFAFSLKAQKRKKTQTPASPVEKRYSQPEVLDSTGQILIYDRLMEVLGDSVRKSLSGTLLEGWKEDQYQSGKLLHKGFYKGGQLSMFRNFFENGKAERVFARIDSLNSNLEIFYENGNQRRQINYYRTQIKRYSEFYENGLLKRSEEYNPSGTQLLKRKLWYPNGTLNEEISLSDAKTLKYQHKIYHNNGKLAESGVSYVHGGNQDLQRSGTWILQDSTGAKKKSKSYPVFK